MDIKSPRERNLWIVDVATWAWRRWVLRLLGAILLLGVGLSAGAYLQRSGALTRVSRAVGETLDRVGKENVGLLSKVGSGMLASPERLVLSIKFEDYEKLKQQRATALETQVLTVTSEDYVNATLEHDGVGVPVKMRLKGDLTDHLQQGEKWSFRIRVRGDNTFLGMKQFSLHHPNARNYVYEWLFHRALQREDVLALRYDFVKVTLNGKDLGVYALEEHFEKRLVEHNRRREGPIIRFSEDRLWEEWRQQKIPFDGARQNGGGSYLASDIDAFQTQRWSGTPEDRAVHDRAIALLASFRSGARPTSEVFDVEKLARFLAVSDLMGAEHGARWHNTRYYYNPVTSRLEPIGFDGDSGKRVTALVYHLKDRHWSYNAWSSDPTYYKSLFQDPLLVEAYLRALDRVSEPEYLDTFFREIDAELRQKLRIIYSEDPLFDFDRTTLYRNQRYIRTVLYPQVAVAAYVAESAPDNVTLRLGNPQALPVDIVGIRYRGERCGISAEEHRLPGRYPTDLVKYTDVRVTMPSGETWDESHLPELRVEFRVPGTSTIREATVAAWPFQDTEAKVADVLHRHDLASLDFLHVNEADRTIAIASGEWRLSNDLVVPPGYTLKCGPATRLSLVDSALVFSSSPLEFVGSASAPIIIDSPDGTGQGLVVMKATRESILDQVWFQGLSSPARPGWALTGAVTFYESPASFRGCTFADNASEDALNTIRSEFRITDCHFSGAASDAFDADFCVGEIRDTLFEHSGNDGVDVSGSTVSLHGLHIVAAGDKGISVGENSSVEASGVSVERSRVGIAVKDLSRLNARDVTIRATRIGIAAYRKKPEFGPSSGVVTQLTMESVKSAYMIELGCTLDVDGAEIAGTQNQVARTLELEQSPAGTSAIPKTREADAG